jgi:ATP-binding cassette, subfamily F, member 3
MSLLVLDDVHFSLAGRTLLDGAALSVDPGRKVGLIGRNGAGKSTLLRLIAGELTPDGGKTRIAARARMAYVAQEAPSGDATPFETVLAADTERTALLAALEDASAAHQAEVHERLRAIGADAAPARAATILDGLGFDSEAQTRRMSDFSGGWRMRVALAAALFAAPDLLLLDEPTNHLDLEATLWLEGYLRKFPGAIVLVSHDRQLLDRAVDAIAHLDRGKISLTPGGFAEFLRIRTERALQQNREAARVSRERAHIQSFVDRFRAKATKARQAQSRLKALERLPQIDSVVEETPVSFSFPSPRAMAPPILALDRAAVGYGGAPVLRNLNLRLDMEDRIALLGPNGNGKSTFAKLLAGQLTPQAGEMRRASGLTVGYFAQHQSEALDLAGTPLSHLAAVLPRASETMLRAQAARFGLDEARANTKVGALSGGERARLLLALATREAPSLLILDEPTNHLDIDARDALIKALADFEGAVVLISHDPYLVDLVADRLLLVGNGTVSAYDGDIESYAATVNEAKAERRNGAATAEEAANSRKEARKERAGAREATAPLRRAARAAEAAIAKLAQERGKLEAGLANPAFYAKAKPEEITRINQRLAAIARETEAAEAAWLEAETALEESA